MEMEMEMAKAKKRRAKKRSRGAVLRAKLAAVEKSIKALDRGIERGVKKTQALERQRGRMRDKRGKLLRKSVAIHSDLIALEAPANEASANTPAP